LCGVSVQLGLPFLPVGFTLCKLLERHQLRDVFR
jgi:hypothetical protein